MATQELSMRLTIRGGWSHNGTTYPETEIGTIDHVPRACAETLSFIYPHFYSERDIECYSYWQEKKYDPVNDDSVTLSCYITLYFKRTDSEWTVEKNGLILHDKKRPYKTNDRVWTAYSRCLPTYTGAILETVTQDDGVNKSSVHVYKHHTYRKRYSPYTDSGRTSPWTGQYNRDWIDLGCPPFPPFPPYAETVEMGGSSIHKFATCIVPQNKLSGIHMCGDWNGFVYRVVSKNNEVVFDKFFNTPSASDYSALVYSSSFIGYSQICTTPEGEVFVVLEDNGAIKVTKSNSQGKYWTVPQTIAPGINPAYAVDQKWNIHYVALYATDKWKLYRSTDSGNTWSFVSDIVSTTNNYSAAGLEVSSDIASKLIFSYSNNSDTTQRMVSVSQGKMWEPL